MSNTTKTCITCKETKPHAEFYKSKSQKDGHDAYCKVCRKAKNREYHERTHPDYWKNYYITVQKPRREAQKQALERLRELDPTWEPSA